VTQARSSETLVNFYQTIWHYNPEDSHLHTHRRENLKSYYITYVLHSAFPSIMPDSFKKCYFVWHMLKQGSTHNSTSQFEHPNFVLISLFFAEHMQHQTRFPSEGHCSLLSYVKSGQLLLELVGLPHGMGWSMVEAPPPRIMFLTKASLKF
jgi:hypothetical protein